MAESVVRGQIGSDLVGVDQRRFRHKKSPPECLRRADASPGWLLRLEPHPLSRPPCPGAGW